MKFFKENAFRAFRAVRSYFSHRGLRKRFVWINKLYKYLNKQISPEIVTVQGHKMCLDSQDSLNLAINGVYEPFQTSLVRQYLKEGNIVLDIGANIGYYTLIFAQLVGERGKVIAFEPEPYLMNILAKNVELNGYTNISLVQKAVSNQRGTATLQLDEFANVDHRLYDASPVGTAIQVETIKIDDCFPVEEKTVDFIKMDIQGSEGRALAGMKGILERNRTLVLITEFWPARLQGSGTSPKDFIQGLLDSGFEIRVIDERLRKLSKFATPEEIIEAHSGSENSQTNLLCVKE